MRTTALLSFLSLWTEITIVNNKYEEGYDTSKPQHVIAAKAPPALPAADASNAHTSAGALHAIMVTCACASPGSACQARTRLTGH